jgi:hypothetical protein
MKAWDQFYPYILVDVLGCPNPVVDNALRIAAREFCQTTKAIREWSDPVIAAGGETSFDFDLPTGQELVKVIKVNVNDDVDGYDVISYKDLPNDWQATTPVSIGNKVVQLDQETYRVFPAPVAGDVIALQIATKPTATATTVHDDLVNRFADAIAAGAKARLMASVGVAWSSPALAGVFKNQFDAAMRSAANEDFRQRSPHRGKLLPI